MNRRFTEFKNCSKFGGVIYISDFNTEVPAGNIAKRIASDWRFDEQCRKNETRRDKNQHTN